MILANIRCQRIIDVDESGYARFGISSGTYAWRIGAESGALVIRNATSTPQGSVGTAVLTFSTLNVATFVSSVLLPDGGVGSPSLSFSGDTTTGFYRGGPGDVRFTAAGSFSLGFQGSGTIFGANGTTQTIAMPTAGSITLTAAGTNQNVVINPSGSGRLNVTVGTAAPGVIGYFNTTGTIGSGNDSSIGIGDALSSGRSTFLGTGKTAGGIYYGFVETFSGGTALVLQRSAGNVLINTTTNGTGALQFAATTTSAGGIGFGTDIFLYRSAARTITLSSGAASNANLVLQDASVDVGVLTPSGNQFLISSNPVGGSIVLRTAGSTVALTLASTQVATFTSSAGSPQLIVNNTGGTNPGIQLQEGGTAALNIVTSARAGFINVLGANSLSLQTNSTTALTLDSSQNAQFVGTVSVASTGTNGLKVYNTSDQTTNYERISAYWTSNVAEIGIQTGGTGANNARVLNIVNYGGGGGSSKLTIASWQQANNFTFGTTNSWTTAGYFVGISPSQNSAGSGSFAVLSVTPTYNQASGNAANTDLLINRTQTLVGSGAQLLIDAQVSTVSKFSVSNTGAVITAGGITVSSGTLIAPVFQTSTAAGATLVYSSSTDTDTGIVYPGADQLAIYGGGVELVRFDRAAGSNTTYFTGVVFPSTDNLINLGKTTNRWATVYATNVDSQGSSLVLRTGGTAALTIDTSQNAVFAHNLTIGASDRFRFSGSSAITAPSDGVLLFTNSAITDLTRVQLGGTTASYPAIKRSSASIAFRLADDSADCNISAATVTASGAVTSTTSLSILGSVAGINKYGDIGHASGGRSTFWADTSGANYIGGYWFTYDNGADNRWEWNSTTTVGACIITMPTSGVMTFSVKASAAITAGNPVNFVDGLKVAETVVTVPLSTVSSSTTTGALVVTGGAGIGGALFVGSTGNFAASLTCQQSILVSRATAIGIAGYSQSAWTTTGAVFSTATGQTYTDSSTAISGTAATAVFSSFAVPTIAASNTGVIVTNAANVYIAGNPAAGTNVTLTNTYGLWNVGKTRLDSDVLVTGNILAGAADTYVIGSAGSANRFATIYSLSLSSGSSGSGLGIGTGVATQGINFSINGTANISFGGTSIAAWGTAGARSAFKAVTYTDTSTGSPGTVATAVFDSFAIPVMAASSANVTATNAATVYIAGGPTAGTNVTITNSYGLWNVGKTRLDSSLSFSTDVTVARVATVASGITSGLVLSTSTMLTSVSGAYALLGFGSLTNTVTPFIDFGSDSRGVGISGLENGGGERTMSFYYRGSTYGSITNFLTHDGLRGRLSVIPVSGSRSAWTTTGAHLEIQAATTTDSSTAISGTSVSAVFSSFAVPTLAATNTGVITTDAATVYIGGSPTAGTNQTITNGWGLWSLGNVLIGNRTSAGTATPRLINMGGTFGSNTAGTVGNLKFLLYDDGSASKYGFGISSSVLEYQTPASAAHKFYTNGGTLALTIDSSQNTTVASGATLFTDKLRDNGGSITFISGGVNSAILQQQRFQTLGSASSNPFLGATGSIFSVLARSVTDTSSSGTVALNATSYFGVATLLASSSTTYTAAASVYIAGAPTASTNVTITNSYALWVVGDERIDGSIYFNGTTPGSITGSSGAVTIAGAGTNQNINLTASGSGNIVVSGGSSARLTSTQAFTIGGTAANSTLLQGGGSTMITMDGSTGALSLNSNGSNQNITLTPSGSGGVRVVTSVTSGGSLVINDSGADSSALRLDLAGVTKAYVGVSAATNALVTGSASGDLVLRTTGKMIIANGTTAAATVSSSGHLLLGGLLTDGTGVLQFATATTSAGGITFSTDTSFYRLAAGAVALDHVGGSSPALKLYENGSEKGQLLTSSGVMTLKTSTSANLLLQTNATTALTVDTSQNVSITPTWNNGSTTFTGLSVAVTDTSSSASSKLLSITGASGNGVTMDKSGNATFTATITLSNQNGSTTSFTNTNGQTSLRNVNIASTNISQASWTTGGVYFNMSAGTATNSSTAISGTAASAVFASFQAPVLAATNTGVITTDAATVYIAGGPTAGTNQTITNSWALWNAGSTRLDGGQTVGVAVKTVNYTIVSSDFYISANSSNPITITLIAASTNTGKVLKFKNKNTGIVTIDATGLGQIYSTEATNTYQLEQGEAITLTSDGSIWMLEGGYNNGATAFNAQNYV